jgi:hypothetical protein
MTKIDEYRKQLSGLRQWEPYLLKHSGLPGPRGNLELAQAAADAGSREQFQALLKHTPDRAPTNDPHEFLAFCGVIGLGRLVAEGDHSWLPEIRRHASDPRWRLREGVAMALQRWGRADMPALIEEMRQWARGNPLEQRAAAAALCEPDLLGDPAEVREVLAVLEAITASLERARERRSEDFKALCKGLAYCWSVAVAALPTEGKRAMQRWFGSTDADVRWVMLENLKKKRLERMDAKWVGKARTRLETRSRG